MKRTLLFGLAGVTVLALLGWGVNVGLQYLGRKAPLDAPAAATPAPAPTAHITATLFYGARDGLLLQPVRIEVPLAEGALAQGRQIVRALLQPPPAPYVPVIPPGTTLKAFYLTSGGDAFVDLSAEVTTKHTGGSMDEILTVYTIVNALTVNLPAITRVQILVDGKEVDTLAGHVDLRNPLSKNLAWVTTENPS